MNEIWKNIDGYEGLYQVSNLGRVKSMGNGNSNNSKEKILKPSTKNNGYLFIGLSKDGKVKQYLVHRLVASAFIDNPNNLPEVNHINEIKSDNNVENLEWCSRVYNASYSLSKPIYSINITTNEITYYQSANEAERIAGINQSHICSCCNGKRKTTGGRYWYYVN